MSDTASKPKRPGRLAAPTSLKQPLNLRLDAGAIYLLKRHALATERTCSDIVAGWIKEHVGALEEAD
jgi:hypothetical protein